MIGKKTEEAELQEIYETLTNASPDAIILTDLEGFISYASSRTLDLHGFMNFDELLGKSAFELISPEDREKGNLIIKKTLKEGQIKNLECLLLRKDGSRFVGELNTALINDADGNPKGFMGIARDITERKENEEKLRKSEEMYRLLAENSRDVIYRMSLPEGRYDYVSPAVFELCGYSPAELYATPLLIREIIHPDWRNYFEEQWENLLKGKMPKYYEYPIVHKYGEVKWLHQRNTLITDDEGRPIAIEAVVTDITDRKRIEDELRQSDAYNHSIAEASLDPLFIFSPNGKINDVNTVTEALTGYSFDELMGTDFSDYFTDPEKAEAALKKVLSEGSVRDYELEIKHRDGSLIPVLYNASVYRDENGEIMGIFAAARDISEIKKAEKALKDSEMFLRMVTDNILDAVVLIDAEGIIRYVSPSVKPIAGYEPEEIVGRSNFDFIHHDDLEKVSAVFRKNISTLTSEKLEYRVEHSDGHYLWVETIGNPIFDEKNRFKYVIIIMRDITERKQAEKALRENEEQLSLVTDNMLNIVGQIDENLLLKYVTPSVEQILGYDQNQLLGKNVFELIDLVHPQDLEMVRLTFMKASKYFSTGGIQHRFKHADGHYVWLESLGNPLKDDEGRFKGVVFSSIDITKNKKIEKALTESETNYRTIFENTGTATVLFGDDNILTMVNNEFEKLSGYSKEEIEGKKKLMEFVTKDDVERMRNYHLQVIDPDAAPRNYEFKFIDRGGDIKDIFGTISGIPGTKKSLISLLDITEHKKAQDQIKKSLEEKEILLKEVHHRVKNNMQIISSLIGLQARFAKDEQTIKMFEDSRNRIRSMAIIHENLYRSRSLARIDFAAYIQSLIEGLLFSYKVDSRIIHTNLKVDKMLLNMDTAISCGLIVNELVTNCIKHAFPAGREGEISIDLRSNDDENTLVVSDNGVGFPEDLDFQNTESLGLQIVCILVDQLDGTIELDRNNGTEFKIKFKNRGNFKD